MPEGYSGDENPKELDVVLVHVSFASRTSAEPSRAALKQECSYCNSSTIIPCRRAHIEMEIICPTEKELSSPHNYNQGFHCEILTLGEKNTNPNYKICPPTPECILTKTEQCQSCTWSIKI